MSEPPQPRVFELALLVALCIAAGEDRAAEGYLLELLAWCAFSDRELFQPQSPMPSA